MEYRKSSLFMVVSIPAIEMMTGAAEDALLPLLTPSPRPALLRAFASAHSHPLAGELPSGGRSTGPRRLCSRGPQQASARPRQTKGPPLLPRNRLGGHWEPQSSPWDQSEAALPRTARLRGAHRRPAPACLPRSASPEGSPSANPQDASPPAALLPGSLTRTLVLCPGRHSALSP
ncbi:sal-like protein 3 [Mustela nigripes]|uniref:sal-like protein 3 n=1 Tax=Mustela nigripes TaxID=77151 RepID=UPI002815C982|nr:sal-like protein 3 [Mustela nigripes]